MRSNGHAPSRWFNNCFLTTVCHVLPSQFAEQADAFTNFVVDKGAEGLGDLTHVGEGGARKMSEFHNLGGLGGAMVGGVGNVGGKMVGGVGDIGGKMFGGANTLVGGVGGIMGGGLRNARKSIELKIVGDHHHKGHNQELLPGSVKGTENEAAAAALTKEGESQVASIPGENV